MLGAPVICTPYTFTLGRMCFAVYAMPEMSSAAAHRHHNGIDVVKVIQNLQRDGALARDNVFVVKRVHERIALFFFQFNRLVIRVVVNALHKANLCAVALCGLHLGDRCGVRQTDERFDAVFRCRQRHALCVVARGTGNNAFPLSLLRKAGRS